MNYILRRVQFRKDVSKAEKELSYEKDKSRLHKEPKRLRIRERSLYSRISNKVEKEQTLNKTTQRTKKVQLSEKEDQGREVKSSKS